MTRQSGSRNSPVGIKNPLTGKTNHFRFDYSAALVSTDSANQWLHPTASVSQPYGKAYLQQ
jgi:hypothetical protein